MEENRLKNFIVAVLDQMPAGWLSITTHRLDIYNEELAKVEFLDQLEAIYQNGDFSDLGTDLYNLPTAYDYIRLGHPLSCVLEWVVAKSCQIGHENVISFSSETIALMAILRKNLLDGTKTRILYQDALPDAFDADILRSVYGYDFELNQIESITDLPAFSGSTVRVTEIHSDKSFDLDTISNQVRTASDVGFQIYTHATLGSLLVISDNNSDSISDIQHVRRRETIAMTPADCQTVLHTFTRSDESGNENNNQAGSQKSNVHDLVREVTQTDGKVLVGSSGLSIQYAILMGLIDYAYENHQDKAIKIIVPTNCYGGTNDQARRVAACLPNVDIVDLAVDGESEMVQSMETVLAKIADQDAVPLLIAEIPTNPRVEVPDLVKLKDTLSKVRMTKSGEKAVDPVFILDQTFCPNITFLAEGGILSSVRTIAFASGSKFPSGGRCTAGYCVGNQISADLMDKVDHHLTLCDNEATDLQYTVLAEQLPSMIQRIADAYQNTRDFVTYIDAVLPNAKINFVSEELAVEGFTPSVFSMDLPTKGNTDAERESYKRQLNLKLINMMITKIPDQSKFCVSYGQLKGCYWTIPATSTQGTTKEGDKDYIVRASLSPDMDLELHKRVFLDFVEGI